MSMQPFHVTEQPFRKGTTLIEASAGTGKTYSISYLVLRLIIEKELPIEQILTVTFTKAATEELRERIRAQLYVARAAYDVPSEDDTLRTWVEGRREHAEQDKERLVNALANIDQANIFTIHGFCQRVLSEFPLESGQAFTVEMTDDLGDLQQQVVQDFWRQQIFLASEQRALWLSDWVMAPDTLTEWLQGVGDDEVTLIPEPQDLDTLWAELEQAAAPIENWHQQQGEQVLAWLQTHQELLKASGMAVIEMWPASYRDLLSRDDLFALLNGSKFRGVKGAERKEQLWEEFVASFKPPVISAERFQQALGCLEASFKAASLTMYRTELQRRQDQQGVMGFNDLVLRLANVLKTRGEAIRTVIQGRYQAALIDEFQDTDADQWRIFSDFFATGEHYLYLIGDPKQAIYKFRGADIDTYLAASRAAGEKLTLERNWRSTPALIAATNAVFEQVEQPFALPGLDFYPVKAGREMLPDAGSSAALRAWLWPQGDLVLSADEQAGLIRRNVCRDILGQLQERQRLPSDIAILVRSHNTAEQYMLALNRLGVPAVVKSKQSVFVTDEAKSLRRVMRAVLNLNRFSLVREALGEPLFGLSASEFFAVTQSDNTQFEAWMSALQQAAHVWQRKSFLPALMPLFRQYRVFDNMQQFPNAERRITNLLHSMELLQQQVLEEQLTPTQTLQYLEQQMLGKGGEATELRMESDAQAVQIVTVHASKGLQYRVVYCPDLYKAKAIQGSTYKVKQDGVWKVSADSAGKEALKALLLEDLKLEDIRLTYVALTRSEQESIVVMPPQFTDGKAIESSLSRLLPMGVPAHPNIVSETMIDAPPGGHYYDAGTTLDGERLLQFNRHVDTRYRLTSFSRLSQGKLQETSDGKAEDESADGAQMSDSRESPAGLPRGAHFGNLLHDVLEHFEFAALADGVEHSAVVGLCKKYGVIEMLDRSGDEDIIEPDLWQAFCRLISNTVTAPIDADFSLRELESTCTFKELAFYLALHESNTARLNQVMQRHGSDIPYQALEYRDLVGHLNGFVDLIAEHNGRFYVMDYKSNDLKGDYSQTHLHEKMRQANYGLQGVIYSLALHRYLRQRLPGYDFARHYGGVRYLFVRGMDPAHPQQGVYRFDMSAALMDSLDGLFSQNSNREVQV